MRSIITTSAPSSARSRFSNAFTVGPSASARRGIRVRGAAEAHLGAERPEEQGVRPRDARVQHVARDRDDEAREAALLAPDGERVEQRLRGVLVRAVAGVHDRRADRRGDEVRRARGGVAKDDGVGAKRLEVADGVEQRLALGHARRLQRDVHHVGAEALAGHLEGGARARRRLEEDVDDGAPVEDARRSSRRRAPSRTTGRLPRGRAGCRRARAGRSRGGAGGSSPSS